MCPVYDPAGIAPKQYWSRRLPTPVPPCPRPELLPLPTPHHPHYSEYLGPIGHVVLDLAALGTLVPKPEHRRRALPPPRDSSSSLPSAVLYDLRRATVWEPVPPADLGSILDIGAVSLALPDDGSDKYAIYYDGRRPNRLCQPPPPDLDFPNIYDLVRRPDAIPHLSAFLASRQDLFFGKADLANAFWSVRLPEHLRNAFCFLFCGTLWRYSVMPFGWSWAPAALQTLVVSCAAETVRSDPAYSRILVFILLDDVMAAGPQPRLVQSFLSALRRRLARAGFLFKVAKNPPLPSRSLPWCGKVWSGPRGVLCVRPEDATLHSLSLAVSALRRSPDIRACELASLLGSLMWVFAPALLLAAFVAPLYAVLPSEPAHQLVSVTRPGIDLALEGIALAQTGWRRQYPHLTPAPPALDRLQVSPGHGHFALRSHHLLYVDFAEVTGLAALVLVTTQGEVFAQQWEVTGGREHGVGQQTGEFAALAGTIAGSAGSPTPLVILADNAGSVFGATYGGPCPRAPGRAYWARRLARAIAASPPGTGPALRHVRGEENPADFWSRAALSLLDLTLVGRVPVLG